MKVKIELDIPNWTKRSMPREEQVQRNRVGSVLKTIAERLSSAGGSDLEFDCEGIKASVQVEVSPAGRQAA